MRKKAGRYLSDKKFSSLSLSKGTKVEMEHTRSRPMAKSIAKDHLAEHPKYYSYLSRMEKSMKRNKKR